MSAEPVFSDLFATVDGLDPCCLQLLGQFLRSPTPWIETGTTAVARWLSWEPKTVTEHAEHLAAAGLLYIDRPPYSRVRYYVLWCDDCPDEREDDRFFMDGVVW
jgi:hypothetical protein